MATPAPAAPAPTATPSQPAAPAKIDATPSAQAPKAGEQKQGTQPDAKAQAQAVAEAKKYKLLVDGADVEVDETELIRRAQKATGAEKRFEEANRVKQQLDAILSELKDPKKVFQLLSRPEIGHDVKTLASEWLYENVVKPESMPKEQYELQKMKAEFDQIKKERDEYATKYQTEQEQKETALEMERLDKAMKATLESSNLPRTPQTISRMAYYMQVGLQRGVNLTPADVLPLVKNDYEAALKAFVGDLDGDDLENFLGESVAEKIRKHTLAKVQSGAKGLSDKKVLSTSEPTEKRTFLSEKDWSAEMDRRLGFK